MSATGVAVGSFRELRAICGDENTRERPAGGVYVSPASDEEVAAILRLANEHRLSVGPVGGSTEFSATALRTDIVLHTNRLTQIEHYDHADLTVGVGAGTTIVQLSAMVGADKLMFGGDPPMPQRCTVGGLLATAAHGPLRHGYGAVRDYCIGVHFVTGDGRRAKGGGRVVKNVAGYDLMKLLIGSYGTLAVITSASFKLFPAPRQTRSFLAEFATAKEAVEFRDRVIRSPLSPMCLELVSPGARTMMRPQMSKDTWVMCLRAAGSDAVLARYRKELGVAITREVEGQDEQKMWRAMENFPVSTDVSGDTDTAEYQTVDLSVCPRGVSAVIDTLLATPAMGGPQIALTGRVGIGHLRFAIRKTAGIDDALHEFGRNIVKEVAIKVRGAVEPWLISPASLSQMRSVKHALDPNNVLRGRVIA